MPQVPLSEVKISGKAMLRELMIRHGRCLFKLNSKFCTLEKLIKIRDGVIWVPTQSEVVYRECTRPPSCRILAEKVVAYCAQKGLNSGIDVAKEVWPDQEYLVKLVATLSDGDDEIFELDYVPSAGQLKKNIQPPIMVHNHDGLLTVPPALLPKR